MRAYVGEYEAPAAEPLNMGLLAALPTLPLRSRYLASSFLAGRHRSPWKGQSVDFVESRAYQQGDELRRIDWRYFARTDRLTVRLFEHDSQLRIYLVLDTSTSMAWRSRESVLTKLDYARAVLASLGVLAKRQQDAFGLVLAGGAEPVFLKHSSSPAHLQALFARLDLAHPSGRLDFVQTGEQVARLVPPRSLIVWAGDFYEETEAVRATLRRLRYDGHDVLGLQVLDPAEVDFDIETDGLFFDVESGFGLPVSTESARQSYLKNFRAFQDALQAVFHEEACDLAMLRTDEPPSGALAAFLARRDHMA
jgi:uncharacterized protein (DUF58 family)